MHNNDHDLGEEYCPNCGQWLPLVDDTGWCAKCTLAHYPDRSICEQCNSPFKQNDKQHRVKCPRCRGVGPYRNLSYSNTEADANHVELYMRAGLTYELAVERVAFDKLPICNCCGKKIKGGTPGRALFCRTNASCKTAGRRYKYLKETKNMTRNDALKRVIETLRVAA